MQSIPKIIQQNKVFSEEKISNQSNLFENQSENHYEKFEFEISKKWSKKNF